MNLHRQNVILFSFLAILLLFCVAILEGIEYENRDRFDSTRVLCIPNNDEFFFGRDKIAQSGITLRAKQFRENFGTDETIHIRTGRDVRMGTIISVVTAIEQIGHKNVSLALLFKKGEYLGSIDSEILVSAIGCDEVASKQDGHGASMVSAEIGRTCEPVIKIERLSERENNLSLNSEPTSISDLRTALAPIFDSCRMKRVYVQTTEDTLFQEVADVVNLAKNAGAKTIHIQQSCRPRNSA